MKRSLLLLLVLCLPVLAQGPLEPPAGPPSPKMKTLDQVEPRIPVSATTAPADGSSAHVISQPGSYYLQGNVAAAGKSIGVTIQAAGATLDLSGFTISGAPTAALQVNSGSRATVRNGILDASGGTSSLRSVGEVIAEDLVMRGSSGLAFYAEGPATMRRCQISNCTQGAYLNGGASLVADCVIRDISGGPAVTFRGAGSDLRDSVLARIDLTAPYTQAIDLGGSAHRVTNNRIGPVGGRGILATGPSHEVRDNHIVVTPSGPALEADTRRVYFRGNTFESPGNPTGMIRGMDGGGNVSILTTNTAPTAVINAPGTVPYTQPINLSGNASSDAEGDALTFAWSIVERPASGAGLSGSGSSVTLPASQAAPLAPGQYRFRLVITDALGSASTPVDAVVIVVVPEAPTAVLDQTTNPARVGQVCVLSGNRSSAPAPASISSYTFTLITRPAGSTRPLNSPVTQSTPTFNGFTPDVAGNYQWRLVAKDSNGTDSSAAALTVVATN